VLEGDPEEGDDVVRPPRPPLNAELSDTRELAKPDGGSELILRAGG